jgi:hypothetical protein
VTANHARSFGLPSADYRITVTPQNAKNHGTGNTVLITI